MARKAAQNTFQDGLTMDLNPINQPSTSYSDCLNGTLITYNGNEYIMQNDQGNIALSGSALDPNYIPVGAKEHGGILYIVSYNPFTKHTQLGSFPSPIQTTISPDGDLPGHDLKSLVDYTDKEEILYSEIKKELDTPTIFVGENESEWYVGPNDQYNLTPNKLSKTEICDDDAERDSFDSIKWFVIDADNKYYPIDTIVVDSENHPATWNVPGKIACNIQISIPESFTHNTYISKSNYADYGTIYLNGIITIKDSHLLELLADVDRDENLAVRVTFDQDISPVVIEYTDMEKTSGFWGETVLKYSTKVPVSNVDYTEVTVTSVPYLTGGCLGSSKLLIDTLSQTTSLQVNARLSGVHNPTINMWQYEANESELLLRYDSPIPSNYPNLALLARFKTLTPNENTEVRYVIPQGFTEATVVDHTEEVILSGTILDQGDLPIENATITLYYQDKIVTRIQSDSEGKFLFKCPEIGTYHVTVNAGLLWRNELQTGYDYTLWMLPDYDGDYTRVPRDTEIKDFFVLDKYISGAGDHVISVPFDLNDFTQETVYEVELQLAVDTPTGYSFEGLPSSVKHNIIASNIMNGYVGQADYNNFDLIPLEEWLKDSTYSFVVDRQDVLKDYSIDQSTIDLYFKNTSEKYYPEKYDLLQPAGRAPYISGCTISTNQIADSKVEIYLVNKAGNMWRYLTMDFLVNLGTSVTPDVKNKTVSQVLYKYNGYRKVDIDQHTEDYAYIFTGESSPFSYGIDVALQVSLSEFKTPEGVPAFYYEYAQGQYFDTEVEIVHMPTGILDTYTCEVNGAAIKKESLSDLFSSVGNILSPTRATNAFKYKLVDVSGSEEEHGTALNYGGHAYKQINENTPPAIFTVYFRPKNGYTEEQGNAVGIVQTLNTKNSAWTEVSGNSCKVIRFTYYDTSKIKSSAVSLNFIGEKAVAVDSHPVYASNIELPKTNSYESPLQKGLDDLNSRMVAQGEAFEKDLNFEDNIDKERPYIMGYGYFDLIV